MKFFDIINRQRIIYLLVYFLLLLHFVGGIISNIAILITSLWIFYYIVFVREWDIYLIFLLIVPIIIFTAEADPDAQTTSNILLRNFKNVWIIGPFALSSAFLMALAIPFRLFIDFGISKHKYLTITWLINLLLAIAGLVLAVITGEENPSGLTVGFRIALSLGAILLTKSISDKEALFKGLDKIILVSLLLLILGIMHAHWYFIVLGFIPYIWYRIRPRALLLIPLIYSVYTFFNFRGRTVTMLGILIVSLVFFFLMNWNDKMRRLLVNKYILMVIIIIPILFTMYTISINKSVTYDLTTVKGYVEFKLLGDRKPLWEASWKDIWDSSLFVKPGGGQINVYFDYINKWQDWTAGSHNIFLEIGRQIGAFSMITLSFLILAIVYKAGKYIRSKNDLVLYYCFISIFLVFGLTGQSLIYDGVGALYWLLFSQMYQLLYLDMHNAVNEADTDLLSLPDGKQST